VIDFLCTGKRYNLQKHENKSTKLLMEGTSLNPSPKTQRMRWGGGGGGDVELRRRKENLFHI